MSKAHAPAHRRRIAQRFRGINTRLFLLLLAVLVPLLVIEAVNFYDRFQATRRQALLNNLEVARGVGKAFHNFVMDVVHHELTIGIAATASPPLAPAELTRLLVRSAEDFPAIRAFHWLTPDGRIGHSSDAQAIGIDLADRSYFTALAGSQEREWLVADLVVSRLSHAPTVVIARAIRAPGGELLGLVAAAVEPERLDSVLALDRPPEAGISLTDSKGMLVYRFPHLPTSWEQRDWYKAYAPVREALAGREATDIAVAAYDGKRRFIANAPIPSIGWAAGAGQRENEAIREENSALMRHGLMVAVTAFFSWLVAFWLARTIASPLGTISQQLTRIGRGELKRLGAVQGPMEIEQLAKAFDSTLETLRRTSLILQSVSELTPDHIYVKDRQSRMLYANPALLRTLGKSAEELLGRTNAEWLADPQQAEALMANDREVLRCGSTLTVEETMNSPAGTAIYLSNKSPLTDEDGNIVGIIGISSNITQRKQTEKELEIYRHRLEGLVAERTQELTRANEELKRQIAERKLAQQQLRDNEEQFRALFDNSLDGILFTAPDGAFFAANRSACDMLGWSQSELCQDGWRLLMDPSEPCLPQALQELTQRGRFQGELHFMRREGSALPVECTATVFSLANGTQRSYMIFRDIGQRKAAEQALHNSQQRLELALLATQDAIWDWDLVTDTNFYSPRWWSMLGYRPEEIPATPDLWRRVIHPQDLRSTERVLGKALARDTAFEFNARLIHKEGHALPILVRGFVLRDASGKAVRVSGTVSDLTQHQRLEQERREWERQRQQLEKAESLNRMAGAIAHHFNNQLSAVIGNLELALEILPREGRGFACLTGAMEAANRAAQISSQLLTYLGQSIAPHGPLDLAETCRGTLPTLQAAMPPGIALQTDLSCPGPIVHANPVQLQHVLKNLVTNAIEAMGAGPGRIQVSVNSVATAFTAAKYRFPVNWQPKQESYACLSVRDSGCGIAETDIEKLFDPFYSSKFTGRGLGLPVSLGIVRAHQGAITVQSEPGRGSVFRVFLPLSAPAAASEPGERERAAAMERQGTVLLIEDELQGREVVETMLIGLGFGVLSAGDGVEALELFRQHPGVIRLVLCDLIMPKMNGWQTMAALRELEPGLPIILTSGYDETQAMEQAGAQPHHAFLQKPYGKQALQAAIAKALGAAPP